jgi:hypothetical protein
MKLQAQFKHNRHLLRRHLWLQAKEYLEVNKLALTLPVVERNLFLLRPKVG